MPRSKKVDGENTSAPRKLKPTTPMTVGEKAPSNDPGIGQTSPNLATNSIVNGSLLDISEGFKVEGLYKELAELLFNNGALELYIMPNGIPVISGHDMDLGYWMFVRFRNDIKLSNHINYLFEIIQRSIVP